MSPWIAAGCVYLGVALLAFVVFLLLDVRKEVVRDIARGGDGRISRIGGDGIAEMAFALLLWPVFAAGLAILGTVTGLKLLVLAAVRATVTEEAIMNACKKEESKL